MASYVRSSRRWKARVKRNDIEYYLGYFRTKEEAEEREREFASRFPSMRGSYQNA